MNGIDLKFPTQFSKRDRFFSNLGDRERIIYQPRFADDGTLDLVESGRENLYSFIQSHAESVDIHVLLARYKNGEVDALSRVQGAYGDFTDLPTTYAELLNRVNEGRAFFDSLPVDIRAKFDHNFAQFMAGMDKPDFLDKLGIKAEPADQHDSPDVELTPVKKEEVTI